jgi:hypothetical protein
VARCSKEAVVINGGDSEGRRLDDFIDHVGVKMITGMPGRSLARRPRIPVILESRGRPTHLTVQNEVSSSSDLVNSGGTEDDDNGWITVGGRGDWVLSDPAKDLRPIGVKSKFWAIADDDESDEEIIQSLFTPDLVRQAAVHGFGKEKLAEAETALHDSSIQRRVEASTSPASSDTKVVLVRNIFKSWVDRRRPSMTPWSGKLPRPRTSPAMTLGDCAATILRGRRSVLGGIL